ncbi:MAG: phytoene desaturase family protein [Sphaerochaeta sp.]|jgi:phytoene desaturase|uniref:Phytoene desaturase n=1 Tax=Sphaerochaeta halotolerans TaxID=2293840 RepID=A0A372MIQ6_9SPIR|nr:phytoene desaturase family protein [Sphaerochaeta halotolerans]RFU95639.1 phytoene desaturase [Sphaerochaeta halotolerans]
MNKKAVVIGGGFGGLSTAALLARDGWIVTLVEKNAQLGGRARYWKKDGFTFDMGPSWYLMPEVFEHYFTHFEKKREDYYDLSPIDPYYKVYFEGGETAELTPRFEENQKLFESFEKGGGKALKAYMEQSSYKYDVAMGDFLYREYKHIGQFFNRRLMTEGLRLGVLGKLDTFVSNYVKDYRAKQILEYAMVFLGTDPAQAPAIYSIMTHVDLNLGVFFPQKGMAGVAEGFASLCRELGVELITDAEVLKVLTEGNRAVGVETNKGTFKADVVVSSADYHHSDTNLLETKHRTYSDSYWEKRVVAPSMFIAYLGIGRELKGFEHHNLYFAKDWDKHFDAIFKNPSWPKDPCFYLSCISKTDPSSAPAGCENVFLLVPVAPGLVDTEEQRNAYFEHVADHVQKVTGEDIRKDLLVKRLYSHRDFISDYHAYKGTALGLSHTLMQTAVFRPRHQNKTIKNLYYTGQYTHPGIGVPMVLIASELIAKEIQETYGS